MDPSPDRLAVCAALLVASWAWAGCGGESSPPPSHRPAGAAIPAAAASVAPASARSPTAADGRPDPASRAAPGAGADVLARVRTAEPGEVGQLTADLVALGAAALPALQAGLRSDSVTERRVAVMALLQLGRDAAPAAGALLAARSDPDPSVRATAQFAWQRAVGDTSRLEALRRADAAANREER